MGTPIKNIKSKLRHGCTYSIHEDVTAFCCRGLFFMGAKKHGLSKHPLYRIWKGIKDRCYLPSNTSYHRYGEKGVIVCDEWKGDFEAFYEWAMLNGWQPGMQIDKDIKSKQLGLEPTIYSPERCSVVTAKRNSNSRSSNRYIEFNGEKLTISEWADKTGIPRNAIRMRLEKYKYTIAEALTMPMGNFREKYNKHSWIEYDGQKMTITKWANELKANLSCINRSIKRGKTFDQIYKFYKNK